jgi:hypothetical protein
MNSWAQNQPIKKLLILLRIDLAIIGFEDERCNHSATQPIYWLGGRVTIQNYYSKLHSNLYVPIAV